LLKLASHRSRQVLTSGGQKPLADDGRDGHRLFAYYFLIKEFNPSNEEKQPYDDLR
jgi:hypothetical protein